MVFPYKYIYLKNFIIAQITFSKLISRFFFKKDEIHVFNVPLGKLSDHI